ncbi:hypothetical protein BD289DRAFT_464849 [Coniella lustricola]|uniref:Secreted protein n=1 Tax=Coniella lustricola TaxID=2025994 RepID=A0A2T3AKF4_9PEZI|nr:hypothetical protein BD289DRAFT_464849 [Coniella lustricola]
MLSFFVFFILFCLLLWNLSSLGWSCCHASYAISSCLPEALVAAECSILSVCKTAPSIHQNVGRRLQVVWPKYPLPALRFCTKSRPSPALKARGKTSAQVSPGLIGLLNRHWALGHQRRASRNTFFCRATPKTSRPPLPPGPPRATPPPRNSAHLHLGAHAPALRRSS